VQSISKLAFEFERRKLAIEEVRELIYREILEYHPQVLQDYLSGGRLPTFQYPSAIDNFKRQFMHLEGGGEEGLQRLLRLLFQPLLLLIAPAAMPCFESTLYCCCSSLAC
jgi:hypothetical protein